MNDWQIIGLTYVTIFIGTAVITILHELGHAFAYLWLTKPESIDIYVGSYGVKQNATMFKQGKLTFYIKRSWFPLFGKGLCVSSKTETNYRQQIIISAAGSVFTFFIACIPGLFVYYTNQSLTVQLIFYIFLGLSALSLLANLVPRTIGSDIFFVEKGSLQNDGLRIVFAIRARKVFSEYTTAVQSMRDKNYDAAIEKLGIVNNAVPKQENVLRYLCSSCLQAKRYDEAELYLEQLAAMTTLQVNDLLNKAYMCILRNEYDEAIVLYQKVLKRNRNNYIALNNLGYIMIKKGAHKVAAEVLEKALKSNPNFEEAKCNQAYNKILQGELDAGKAILDKVLANNPDSANVYLYLAIYYLKLNDRALAETNLAKAQDKDKTIIITDFNDELEKLSESVPL